MSTPGPTHETPRSSARRVLGWVEPLAFGGCIVVGAAIGHVIGGSERATFAGAACAVFGMVIGIFAASIHAAPEPVGPNRGQVRAMSEAEWHAAIEEHLAHGRKIHAIKVYRDATGADLRTAKNAIDAWPPAE